MTVDFLLTHYGNWLLLVVASVVAYIVWREKTVSNVASLSAEIVRLEKNLAELENKLDARQAQDVAIITALAEIKAQLNGVIVSVAEVKAELRHKMDKER